MSDASDLVPPGAAAPAQSGLIDDLEDLFENAPCGYLATDKDGRIVRANQTFARWTGYEAAALTGRRFSDLLSIGGKLFYETHFAPMLHIQGSFNEVALELLTEDGRKLPFLVNAIERRDARGHPSFIRFTLFMAVERRSYERELVVERDEAKAAVKAEQAESELREQFIAVLGHDLRNPLASIASGVRILQKENLGDRARKVLSLMDGSVVRASGLIDNVLDFARGRLGGGINLTRNTREPLVPVLEQVVSELRSIAPERLVECNFAISGPVDCDPARIGQLLSNLLGNALTHGAKDVPVRIEAWADETRFLLSVANGGAPISEAARGRLFEPFYRGDGPSDTPGLGLGLHIAAEIARAHGGALEARSDAKETCFTFTMPLGSSDV